MCMSFMEGNEPGNIITWYDSYPLYCSTKKEKIKSKGYNDGWGARVFS
jgi:hypothetical protein